MHRLFKVSVGAVWIVLSACSAASSTRSETSTATAEGGSVQLEVAAVSDVGVYSLFNYHYRGGGLSDQQISDLRASLIAECMRGRGWTYEVLQLAMPDSGSEPDELNARLSFRRQHGYRISEVLVGPEISKDSDPNIRYFDTLSPAAQAEYQADIGDEETVGTCSREAQEDLGVKVPFMNSPLGAVATDFVTELLTNATYQSALVRYSECMAGYGIVSDSPDSTRSQLIVEFNKKVESGEFNREATPSSAQVEFFKREVTASLADFECDLRNLHETRIAVEKQLLESFVNTGRLPSEWLSSPEPTCTGTELEVQTPCTIS